MTFRFTYLGVQRRLAPYAVTAPRYPRRFVAISVR